MLGFHVGEDVLYVRRWSKVLRAELLGPEHAQVSQVSVASSVRKSGRDMLQGSSRFCTTLVSGDGEAKQYVAKNRIQKAIICKDFLVYVQRVLNQGHEVPGIERTMILDTTAKLAHSHPSAFRRALRSILEKVRSRRDTNVQ